MIPFRALLASSLLAAAVHAAEEPLPVLPAGPFANEYKIAARLDADAMTIEGEETVVFRNRGTAAVAEIPFHLYANAWSSTATRWIRDARGEAGVRDRGEAEGGYLRVDSVALADGRDLSAAAVIDETLLRVALPEPVPPGGEVALVIRFATKLPKVFARMGRWGEHVDAMQWYPKPCAHVGGRFVDWQFTEPSEFFANFADYEVTLALPARFEVEATGTRVRQDLDEASGVRTVVYRASAVHDFAWTADPAFVRHERSRRGVEVVLLSQPSLEPKAQLVLDAVELCLDRYGEWFFPYPYERVVVDALPPGLGGGMEYPMLFTISARAPEFLGAIASRSESPASVTIHEFGHQYWYGIVATNEFEEAWLDEGINTYLTAKLLEELYPPPTAAPPRGLNAVAAHDVSKRVLDDGFLLGAIAGWEESPFLAPDETRPGRPRPEPRLLGFDFPTLRLRGEVIDRHRERIPSYAPVADLTSLVQHSFATYPHHPRRSYVAMAYSKPALMLRTLENLAGWDATLEVLRTYARRHAFGHPTTEDFVAVAREKLAAPHVELLEACIRGSDVVDWAVEEVRAIAVVEPEGFSPQQRPGDPVTARFAAEPDDPGLVARLRSALGLAPERAPVDPVEGKGPAGAPSTWRAEVLVRNHGRLAVPTEVLLSFADGSEEVVAVAGDAPWRRIEVAPRAAKLVSATVDPRRRIALDLDLTNNARLAVADESAAYAAGSFLQFWVQSLFVGVAWLG